MKIKKLKFAGIALMLAGCFFSCETNLDFSNIENLHEQPLHVIQKTVQGSWRLQYTIGGFAGQTIIDTHDSYMQINKNHITIGSNTHGILTDSPITWEKKENFNGDGKSTYLLGYNHTIDNHGKVVAMQRFYIWEIKNDTLVIGEECCDGYTYYYTRK